MRTELFTRVFTGKVWKFGNNTSTDYIMPGFSHLGPESEMAKYCMYSIRPDFAQLVQPGDIIIGGKNFGCGSSRPACRNFAALGIACVVAESLSRLFFRSAINLGYPVLPCAGVYGAFSEGDMAQVDFGSGEVRNLTTGIVLQTDILPEVAMRILGAGGVVHLLRREYGQPAEPDK